MGDCTVAWPVWQALRIISSASSWRTEYDASDNCCRRHDFTGSRCRRLDDDHRTLVREPSQTKLEPSKLGLWACMDRHPAAWSGVLAWRNAFTGAEQLKVIALFGINIFFHMLWSPLFFSLRRPDWALMEIPFLWLSIVGLMFGLAPLSATSVWLLLPYFFWVTFAAFLNLTIVRMNRPFRGLSLSTD